MMSEEIKLKKSGSGNFIKIDPRFYVLEKQLLTFSFFNLFLVACIGLLLRSLPFIAGFPLTFKNILHGHSHFAFGGWLMPVILALIMRSFPEIVAKIHVRHWRTLGIIFLFSAYGMLFTFPVTGYALFSVIFSTVSILGGFYLALVCWKAISSTPQKISLQFLFWGLIYFVISSVGPFTTGPLIVMGYKGEPIYFNAIYFYLHFQYNGWFTFIVLALFYRMLEEKGLNTSGRKLLWILNISIVPTFFLSILWMKPPLIFYIIGGTGAAIQLASIFYLWADVKKMKWKLSGIEKLFLLSMIIFCLKIVLQFISSFPTVAAIAFSFRNFIISYLHLVLLGFISLFLVACVIRSHALQFTGNLKRGIHLFLLSLLTTELILVLHAGLAWLGIVLPNYQQALFIFSIFFPVGFLILWKDLQAQFNLNVSRIYPN